MSAYALALAGGTATGLLTTAGNHAITLVADSASQISGKYDSDGNGSLDATAFTVTLSGTTVTLTSLVALEHDNVARRGRGQHARPQRPDQRRGDGDGYRRRQ